MFHVGQLVVCIKGPSEAVMRAYPQAIYPRIGSIYTIRNVNVWSKATIVLLCEIDNASRFPHEKIEPGFDALHFRPLDPSRISIFTDMLEDAPEPVAPLVTA